MCVCVCLFVYYDQTLNHDSTILYTILWVEKKAVEHIDALLGIIDNSCTFLKYNQGYENGFCGQRYTFVTENIMEIKSINPF